MKCVSYFFKTKRAPHLLVRALTKASTGKATPITHEDCLLVRLVTHCMLSYAQSVVLGLKINNQVWYAALPHGKVCAEHQDKRNTSCPLCGYHYCMKCTVVGAGHVCRPKLAKYIFGARAHTYPTEVGPKWWCDPAPLERKTGGAEDPLVRIFPASMHGHADFGLFLRLLRGLVHPNLSQGGTGAWSRLGFAIVYDVEGAALGTPLSTHDFEPPSTSYWIGLVLHLHSRGLDLHTSRPASSCTCTLDCSTTQRLCFTASLTLGGKFTGGTLPVGARDLWQEMDRGYGRFYRPRETVGPEAIAKFLDGSCNNSPTEPGMYVRAESSTLCLLPEDQLLPWLLPHTKKHECRHCGAKKAKKSCTKCRVAHYCSKACQVNDWKSHKIVCRMQQRTSVIIKPGGGQILSCNVKV